MPDPTQMARELRRAGWRRDGARWIAPDGAWYWIEQAYALMVARREIAEAVRDGKHGKVFYDDRPNHADH